MLTMAENNNSRGNSDGKNRKSDGRSNSSASGRDTIQNSSNRGFAAMDPEERRQAAKRGGEASGESRKGKSRSSIVR